MAIDGPELFQNDDTHSLVDRVAESGAEDIHRALRAVLDQGDDYLDVDVGAEAWAAAELVAAAAREERARTGDEPSTYDEAIATITVDDRLLADSLRVLERLDADDSELAGLLEDMGQRSVWRARLDDLRQRLRRAQQRLSGRG
jgi:hypothetical protein